MYLDFTRQTQRYVPRRHSRSREIPRFATRVYHFTLSGVSQYINKICTRLVYTTDTVPLGYRSVCHNSTFVLLLLVFQFIFNLNLIVNILLRAFKSFLGKYSIVCIFIQTNHFNTHAIFMSFISQSINFSNFLT